jgi:LCP family protein required for cell wall assembly
MAKRRNRRRRRALKSQKAMAPWKIAMAVVGGALVLLTTAGVAFAASKLSKLETTQLDTTKLNISKEVEHNETGYLNIALFGLDSRDDSLTAGDRSDTIIIASLNRETKEVKLCSVYRDTLLEQPDGGYNKANAAYATDGAEGAVSMLNKNLDMDIQHYVTVNFNALVDVIDELGGIEVDLKTPEEVQLVNGYGNETSKVTGKKLELLEKPGKQLLNGVQAVSYSRIRYQVFDGDPQDGTDFRRAERQRYVLEQVMKKAQSADLSTINRIIDKVFGKIGTNFTLTEILAYAKDAFDYKLTDMSGFPFDKTTATLSGVGSTVLPDDLQSNVIELHKFFFKKDTYSPSSTVASISSQILDYSTNTISDEEAATYDNVENSYNYSYGDGSSGTEYTEPSTGTGDQNIDSAVPDNSGTGGTGSGTTEENNDTSNPAGTGDQTGTDPTDTTGTPDTTATE